MFYSVCSSTVSTTQRNSVSRDQRNVLFHLLLLCMAVILCNISSSEETDFHVELLCSNSFTDSSNRIMPTLLRFAFKVTHAMCLCYLPKSVFTGFSGELCVPQTAASPCPRHIPCFPVFITKYLSSPLNHSIPLPFFSVNQTSPVHPMFHSRTSSFLKPSLIVHPRPQKDIIVLSTCTQSGSIF